MSLIVNKGLSALNSNTIELGLIGSNLKQSKIQLDGGYYFNFIDLFANISDVKTKNYTNFYLTNKTLLDENLESLNYKSLPDKFLTTIKNGTTFLSILSVDSQKITSIDNIYPLRFTDAPAYSQYFQFNFLNDEECEIFYDDSIGNNYIALDDNNVCVLKRGVLTTDNERLFNYVLGDSNNISLFKRVNNVPHQLRFNDNTLSAVPLLSDAYDLIDSYRLEIDIAPKLDFNFSKNNSYINYSNQTVDIDLNGSDFNLKGNYLIHRNLSNGKLNKASIIALKNHMNDLNISSRSNNLALGTSTEETLSRAYTSINNDIDSIDSEDLNLNYVFYSKTINIFPGRNEFTTEKSMFPFSQININDTKLAKSGSFASTSPLYSDKIYYTQKDSRNQEYVYLCTWLSGGDSSSPGTWIDRYYYPDLISKQEAISGINIYKETYNNFVEELVFTSNLTSNNITKKLYFDKKSDLVFKPSSMYVYDRVDLDSLDFINRNALIKKPVGYYTDVNKNNGFTLGLNLINQSDQVNRQINSSFNNIPGGLFIVYNNEAVNVVYNLYNTYSGRLESHSASAFLRQGSNNNIVISINNTNGEIFYYVNGDLIYKNLINPLKANTLLYGDFNIGETPLTDASDLISEEFLSTEPLSREETSLLVARYNDSRAPLTIALPCGMRNKQDKISQLNSLTTNLKNKSNVIDINITDLDVDEELKKEIISSVGVAARSFIPSNTEINKINII